MFYIDKFYKIKTRGYIILVNQHTIEFLYKKIYYYFIFILYLL